MRSARGTSAAQVLQQAPYALLFSVCLGIFGISMLISLIFGFVGVSNFTGPQAWLDLVAECQGLSAGYYDIDTPSGSAILSSIRGADQNGFQMMQEDPGIAVGVMFGMFAIALLWLFLLRTFTRVMVWVTLAASVVFVAAAGIAALTYGVNDFAYVCLAVAALEGIFLVLVRKSVNVCADMLQLACEALIAYPSILASHVLLGLVLLTACVVTFVFMVMTQFNIVEVTGAACTETVFAGYIGFFQTVNWLGLCWFIGVIAAARLFVSAFVAGQWYFHRPEDRVPHATSKALLLAFSKSLGTLAIAGIITALVNWAKRKVRKMKRTCNPFMCLLAYLLGCLLSMVEFLNSFATIVASKYNIHPCAKTFVHLNCARLLDGHVVCSCSCDRQVFHGRGEGVWASAENDFPGWLCDKPLRTLRS